MPKELSKNQLKNLLCVQGFEFLSPAITQARAFSRAHQAPVSITFNAFHKQVRNPQSVKQITSTIFFLSGVLLQVQKFENVRMPRFQVNSKCTRPL